MILDFNLNQKDLSDVIRKLGVFELTDKEKKLFAARGTRAILAIARKNIKNQTTIYGTKFIPRKGRERSNGSFYFKPTRRKYHRDGTSSLVKMKKELLVNILKKDHVRVVTPPNQGVIDYKTDAGGIIAFRQQHGFKSKIDHHYIRTCDEAFDPPKNQKRLENGKIGCTFFQAVRLFRLGCLNPHTEKDLSVDEIMSTFSIKQAAFIIQQLKKSTQKSTTIAINPPRPFLGINSRQANKLAQWVMNNLTTNFASGKRLPLPDLSDSEIPF